MGMLRRGRSGILLFLLAPVLLFTLLSSPAFVSRAQEHDPAMHDHSGHEGMNMPPEPTDPAILAKIQAKNLADKRESEFNHHLAGALVILAALFILAEAFVHPRFPFLRFVWPLCFLGASIFLLVFSDTELWPFGPKSWWWGLTQSREDLQHKTFAVILLGLAYIEIQRARGVLTAAWSAWAFPVLAFIGSGLLFFHEHHAGMGGVDHMTHMAAMQRIQSEHFAFSMTGFVIGLTKGLSEMHFRAQALFARLWPVAMIVLGILLMLYTE
jgi:putative copper resistance protein D